MQRKQLQHIGQGELCIYRDFQGNETLFKRGSYLFQRDDMIQMHIADEPDKIYVMSHTAYAWID